MNWTLLIFVAIALVIGQAKAHNCGHDQFARGSEKHYLNDMTDQRLLQNDEIGRIRIFIDYSQVTIGGQTEVNTIKRLMNITASYFYEALNVTRLPRLFFPAGTNRKCNILQIPEQYVEKGTIGDLGVVCGNQENAGAVYVAKSTPCAFLQSNKRPIWGMISFNNAFLKYDQTGFQQLVFVGIHEMTHILGFSAGLFATFPGGNPLVQDQDGYYLTSEAIQRQINKFYGCSKSKGLPLQDQDGTLIASHWEKKVVGHQYMIASNKKGSFMSNFTLALLDSTGWYPFVNYQYGQPSTWGRGKGCEFLNIDNCSSDQFCSHTDFDCDWEGTGIGKCLVDSFTGSCNIVRYYSNTVCVDENYQLKNLNSKLRAFERGGSNSKCFKSNFREEGLQPTSLNNRCYISVCSSTSRFMYILVGSYIMVCSSEGKIINAPPGLEGTLQCPKNFANYCQSKKSCPYHCNKNGACINGQCICAGNTKKSQACIDQSIFDAPIGRSGGLLEAQSDDPVKLDSQGNNVRKNRTEQRKKLRQYSINSKCIQGTAFDFFFGECLKCQDIFDCQNCNDNGCISCDDGSSPDQNRRC